jgi:zinc/manganese transport system ATP-binding protein
MARGILGHAMSDAISFRDLTLGYDRHPAVHHLDGAVAIGDLLAICGPNGAGKSTLLKAIAGALTPLGGAIDRTACDPRAIAYLPQAAELDRSFPIDVFDLVASGFWRDTGWFGGLGAARRQKVLDAISAVGLDGLEDRPIGALSGGQAQRVLFARIIVQDAPVILLDEPLTALDERTSADLIKLIRKWNGEGRTIVAVLHDLDLVRRVFPKTLLLAREKVAWGYTMQALSADNLARARAMCEAFESDAPVCEV